MIHRKAAENAEKKFLLKTRLMVFVCRRLPTNKKLFLCALCVSNEQSEWAVINTL